VVEGEGVREYLRPLLLWGMEVERVGGEWKRNVFGCRDGRIKSDGGWIV
jgi:hypothetical protein